MEERSTATLEKIQQAALAEFLDKGFLGASLRQIVKNAGVTTGAFYGYFSSKEALFASIVEPHAAALMGKFMAAQTSFAELPEEQQPEHMGVESSGCVHWLCPLDGGLHLCPPNGTWRCSAAWAGTSQCWTNPCAISSPAGCSMASLRSWFTICPGIRRCGMWISCGRFTPLVGQN